MQNVLTRQEGETLEQCLWRLGYAKKSGKVGITWNNIADFLNDEFELYFEQSTYRKKFKRLYRASQIKEVDASCDSNYHNLTKERLRDLEKQRIMIREEHSAYRRTLKQEAQLETLVKDMTNAIKRYEPVKIEKENKICDHAIYAMLSDIHYGLAFNSYYNRYSPEIAHRRVMKYAHRLCEIGEAQNADTICVAMLGDMISGNIHQSIRSENRTNVIAQVVGVSELIAEFLHTLSKKFSNVIVANVSGNHSRIEPNPQNALRNERLDMLIPWYCKAKLENVDNVSFLENEVDPTIAMTELFGKTYVAVHGDYDANMKESAVRISQATGKKIDYFLAGHMHVADMRLEDVGYIRNGAVVSGGDEYTSKKRLYGPAVQVCLSVSENGVDAVFPIKLS